MFALSHHHPFLSISISYCALRSSPFLATELCTLLLCCPAREIETRSRPRTVLLVVMYVLVPHCVHTECNFEPIASGDNIRNIRCCGPPLSDFNYKLGEILEWTELQCIDIALTSTACNRCCLVFVVDCAAAAAAVAKRTFLYCAAVVAAATVVIIAVDDDDDDASKITVCR